jgi:hypothetical protein
MSIKDVAVAPKAAKHASSCWQTFIKGAPVTPTTKGDSFWSQNGGSGSC